MVIPGCTPLPETEITALAPWELATVIFPVTFSEEAGWNVTFKEALCPAANVSGAVIPLAVISVALTLT
jgi:hypothetical protein